MDGRKRFLKVATEPFGDNAELQLAARRELESELDPEAGDDALGALAEKINPARRRRLRVAGVALLVLSLAAVVAVVWSPVVALIEEGDPASAVVARASKDLWSRMKPAQRKVIRGEPEAEDHWAWLLTEPVSAVDFAEYSVRRMSRGERLPEDFLSTAGRLAPENGWFPLLAAIDLAYPVIERKRLTSAERRAGDERKFVILDPEILAQAIDQVERASRLPRVDSYTGSIMRRRMQALPPPANPLERQAAFGMVFENPLPAFRIQPLLDVMVAEAQRSADDEDIESWHRLARIYNGLMPLLMDDITWLADGLIFKRLAVKAGPEIVKAGRALGVRDPELDAMVGKIERYQQTLESAKGTRPIDRLVEEKATLAGSFPLLHKHVLDPPAPPMKQVLAVLRVEHAVSGQVAVAGLWLLLVFGMIAPRLVARTRGPLARRIARPLAAWAGWRDWLWCAGLALVVPLLVMLVVRYLTPMGRLEFTLKSEAWIGAAGMWAGLAVSWILASWLVLRWRLGKVRGFAWRVRPSWVGLIALVFALVAMVSFPRLWVEQSGTRWIPCGLLGSAVAVGIGNLLCVPFGPRETLLRRLVTIHSVASAGAMALVVAAGLAFALKLEEQIWIDRSFALEPTVEMPLYEELMAEQLKAELQAAVTVD